MKYKIKLLILCVAFFISCCNRTNDDIVTIGVCTDVHLPTMHDAEYRIQTFIDSMNAINPDFIIELGDFGIPKEEYLHYFDIWNSFKGEKYHVIGNHEMDGGTSREDAIEFRKMKSGYYSFDKNGFHCIVLDGNDKKNPEDKGYKQFVGPKQIEWLKSDLANSMHPVIIFSHQGLQLYHGAEEDYGVENYKEVQAIFEKHNSKNTDKKVIACFNGHSHWDFAERINEIWYVTITSMSYHWLGEDYEYIRYNKEVDKNFKWIKYTAPFKEPLFTVIEISKEGYIKIKGKKSEWVGPSPWELGYPEQMKKYMRPEISSRKLKFTLSE
ncbi:metallophosphoesterase family protein [Maribellus maritimus]|uniref:metallophosphoesterase family protein n=1 Tax=Maribellus maritimus TaxID=2870838 RepID=UPI001EEBA9AA|nr:metallophosphoesterase [Maribellus maritimus]MCG6189330.1 metallophosphoesterase [Maribellus maritimus]